MVARTSELGCLSFGSRRCLLVPFEYTCRIGLDHPIKQCRPVNCQLLMILVAGGGSRTSYQASFDSGSLGSPCVICFLRSRVQIRLDCQCGSWSADERSLLGARLACHRVSSPSRATPSRLLSQRIIESRRFRFWGARTEQSGRVRSTSEPARPSIRPSPVGQSPAAPSRSTRFIRFWLQSISVSSDH